MRMTSSAFKIIHSSFSLFPDLRQSVPLRLQAFRLCSLDPDEWNPTGNRTRVSVSAKTTGNYARLRFVASDKPIDFLENRSYLNNVVHQDVPTKRVISS